MQIAIVFNPGSGKRSANATLSEVVASLESHHHALSVFDCQKHADFERELRRQAPHLDRLIVIGGDGTLGSVINATATSENPGLPVAFVPTGRGKDTARSLPSWKASDMAGSAFDSATTQSIDLIKTTLETGTHRYAVNISSVGLAAHAAAVANTLPRPLGSLSYVLGAVRGFVPLRSFQLSMRINSAHHVFENVLLVAACNGKSFGGGIYIAPDALQDDAQIEVVVVRNANLADLAMQLGKLKSGTAFEHPALMRWQARSITLESIATNHYEADGEALSAQPIKYEIAPGALNWITP